MLVVAGILAAGVRIPVERRPAGSRSSSLSMLLGAHVPMSDWNNLVYLSPASVGSPAQDFNMVFDTGSSVVWTMGSDCYNCDGSGQTHRKFDASKSTSYTPDSRFPDGAQLSYGSGTVMGDVGKDTLTVGDMSVGVSLVNAMEVTEPFPSQPLEGLIGLGLDDGGSAAGLRGYVPWLRKLKESGKVKDTAFWFNMTGKVKPGSHSTNGELVIGDIPYDDLYKGSVHWVPVQRSGSIGYIYWMLGSEGSNVGDTALDPNGGVVVDSGTSLVAVPADAYNALRDSLPTSPGEAQLVVDQGGQMVYLGASCDSIVKSGAKFPDVTVAIGGQGYTLEGADYLLDMGQLEGRTACMVGLMCMQFVNGQCQQMPMIDWLLGDVFHRKFQVTYDFQNMRVGLSEEAKFVAKYHFPIIPVLAGVAVVLAFSAWVYTCYRTRRQSRARELAERRAPWLEA